MFLRVSQILTDPLRACVPSEINVWPCPEAAIHEALAGELASIRRICRRDLQVQGNRPYRVDGWLAAQSEASQSRDQVAVQHTYQRFFWIAVASPQDLEPGVERDLFPNVRLIQAQRPVEAGRRTLVS